MIRFFIILTLLSYQSAFAKTQEQMKSVMYTYLSSIKMGDKAGIKKVVSKKYFQQLNKENGLDELFKMQKRDGKKVKFDLKFQKYHDKKNHYLVNIKDKSQKNYDHNWFVIQKVKNKYIIKEEFYMD